MVRGVAIVGLALAAVGATPLDAQSAVAPSADATKARSANTYVCRGGVSPLKLELPVFARPITDADGIKVTGYLVVIDNPTAQSCPIPPILIVFKDRQGREIDRAVVPSPLKPLSAGANIDFADVREIATEDVASATACFAVRATEPDAAN